MSVFVEVEAVVSVLDLVNVDDIELSTTEPLSIESKEWTVN